MEILLNSGNSWAVESPRTMIQVDNQTQLWTTGPSMCEVCGGSEGERAVFVVPPHVYEGGGGKGTV